MKWIVDPEAMYDEPSVQELIKRFGVKMPKQGVSEEEAKAIVSYLEGWK